MIDQLTKRQTNKTPRYLTPLTFKDILKESDLDKSVILNLKNTILNTIKGIDTLMDDSEGRNKTYIDSFKSGGFTNKMIVDVDDIDSVIYVLMEIGFKEEEIRVEDVRRDNREDYEVYEDYDVEIYILTNRHEFIKRLISYKVMGRLEPLWFNVVTNVDEINNR